MAAAVTSASLRAALAARLPRIAASASVQSASASASLLPRATRQLRQDGGRRASHVVSASAAAEGSADGSVSVAAAPDAAPAATTPDVCSLAEGLELRVGRIIKAWKHPEADSLYVEEVDVGEEGGPRTICSGLVKYVAEEDMQDRLVVVLANLKPRNMRGVKSNGMLLAASDESHENVELLSPPAESVPGERVWFGAEADGATQAAAATPNQLQKKKVWEAVQSQLKTTEECVATLLDKPMRVASGVITCKSLAKANIG
ncbi:hypothetical protein CLOM_g10419 [Closterium sp. NIES-68]|nr:hypothetical protein CLOM_g18783 [Closterium sp. NIES-68]GJP51244.1 hypothetical protein CLOM_g10419 [Closterium sp. NIES-68]GJP74808.1 hypothetical protein CLOP_g5342 [Closterium sp. NIES-67]